MKIDGPTSKKILNDWLRINSNVILASWSAPEAPGIHDLLEMR